MTTSRRSFFKCLVGAFVASAIELNLTVEPRVGQLEAVIQALSEVMEEMWMERYREACEKLASTLTVKTSA